MTASDLRSVLEVPVTPVTMDTSRFLIHAETNASVDSRYATLADCRLADLQTCRLADLQTCRLADLQTWRVSTPVVLTQNHF